MRVLLKSTPNPPVYPEGESRYTSDVLNLQILPFLRSMGLPHLTRHYSEEEAKALLDTYIAHGCEAELIE